MALTVQMLPVTMTSLPMPMQLVATSESSRGESEQFLLQAFRCFAEAADSLERSYGMLRSEVSRLHAELEQSNAGLARSLGENRQMRQHLDRILDGLPCGVLVAKADGAISLMNPEARRLLRPSVTTQSQSLGAIQEATDDFVSLGLIPDGLRALLERARTEPGDLEQCLVGEGGDERWIAVRHAAV